MLSKLSFLGLETKHCSLKFKELNQRDLRPELHNFLGCSL